VSVTKSPKRIGIVDNKLDNFHANTFYELLAGPLAGRGFRITGATAIDRAGGVAWTRERDVPWFETVEQLDSHVDCYMILAPSDPQLHAGMCEQVFPFGKPTFVDKTFAPDLETAKRLFQLADRYGVAVQTSSALRYTAVQRHVAAMQEPLRNLYVWAGGATFAEYGIHPVELVVSCLSVDAKEMMRLGDESHWQLLLLFEGKRSAIIDFTPGVDVPYAAALTTDKSTQMLEIDLTNLFRDALAASLEFIETGVPQVDRAESLLVRNILDLAGSSAAENRFCQFVSPELPRPHTATVRRMQQLSVSRVGQL